MNAGIGVVTGAARAVSPLVRALLGRQPGESISFQGGEAEILVIEV